MDSSEEENNVLDVSADLFDNSDTDMKDEDQHTLADSAALSLRDPSPRLLQNIEMGTSATKFTESATTNDETIRTHQLNLTHQSNIDLHDIQQLTENSPSDFKEEITAKERKESFAADEDIEQVDLDGVVEGLPKKRHKLSNHEESCVDDSGENFVSTHISNVLESSVDPNSEHISGASLDSTSQLSSSNERVNTDLSENISTRNKEFKIGVETEKTGAIDFNKEDNHRNVGSTEDKGESMFELDVPSQSSKLSDDLRCPFCSMKGTSLSLLEFHIETMHPEIGLMNDSVTDRALSLPQDDMLISNSDILDSVATSSVHVNPFQFVCPFCDLDLTDEVTLALHISAAHEEENVEPGDVKLSCALCDFTSSTENDMTKHMKSHASDSTYYGISVGGASLSLAVPTDTYQPSGEMVCPVCGISMVDADLLTSHVESHFNPQHSPGKKSNFADVVKNGNKENVPLKSDSKSINFTKSGSKTQQSSSQDKITPSTSKGKVNFPSRVDNVRDHTGFKVERSGSKGKTSPSRGQENVWSSSSSGEDISYKKLYEQNLEKAVMKGAISVADYHEKKTMMSRLDFNKDVDDGQTRVQGLIGKLENLFQSQARPRQTVHLCSPTDHFSGSYGDKGWGCGYRNLQMILSCLVRDPVYARRIFPDGGVNIPSIPKIQEMIESAWQKGFDPQGRSQLGGRLVNTRKWIGATEIVATLSSLGIKCRLADFHSPSGSDGTHPRLLEWITDYFIHSRQQPLAPLYLQHQGHSRTVVGVETERGTTKVLLFDPGTSSDHMATLAKGPLTWKQMRTFRRTQAGFKSRQYQIVAVEGLLTTAEYQESKILKSDRVS